MTWWFWAIVGVWLGSAVALMLYGEIVAGIALLIAFGVVAVWFNNRVNTGR